VKDEKVLVHINGQKARWLDKTSELLAPSQSQYSDRPVDDFKAPIIPYAASSSSSSSDKEEAGSKAKKAKKEEEDEDEDERVVEDEDGGDEDED